MERPPSPTMVRIIELLRDGPRDRVGIAGALKIRASVTGSILTAMEYRQIVLKEGDRYSLRRRRADALTAKIEALIDAARKAYHDDETIADALEQAATALLARLA